MLYQSQNHNPVKKQSSKGTNNKSVSQRRRAAACRAINNPAAWVQLQSSAALFCTAKHCTSSPFSIVQGNRRLGCLPFKINVLGQCLLQRYKHTCTQVHKHMIYYAWCSVMVPSNGNRSGGGDGVHHQDVNPISGWANPN